MAKQPCCFAVPQSGTAKSFVAFRHHIIIMTKYVAPAEPTGRWKQYNEAYREINANAFLAEFPEALAEIYSPIHTTVMSGAEYLAAIGA